MKIIVKKYALISIIFVLSSILVACDNNDKRKTGSVDTITIELYDESSDENIVESNMKDLFYKLGNEYEYTYDNNIIELQMPKVDALEFSNRLNKNIESRCQEFIDNGYVNSVESNADYTEIDIDFSAEVSDEIKYKIIMFLATDSATYQSFNGVLANNINLHLKVYQDGEFIHEDDFRIN